MTTCSYSPVRLVGRCAAGTSVVAFGSRPQRLFGVPGAHFHDLRHTGNNLTAQAGANLRELMERMGHSSPRAALIYLHATTERQRALADTLGTLIESTMSGRASDQTQ